MRRYLRDPTFSRFDTIPECDRHTHTHTHTRRHIPRLARRRAVKNVTVARRSAAAVAGVGLHVNTTAHVLVLTGPHSPHAVHRCSAFRGTFCM